MTGRWILRLVAPGLCVLALAAAASGSVAADLRERFAAANELYEGGEYEDAVAAYRDLEESGLVSEDLYYNLGNAFYKVGNLGWAVLYYERALRIAPRDPDIRRNLELTNALLRDRQFVGKEGFVTKVLTAVPRRMNLSETMLLSSVLYVFLAVFLIAYIFRHSTWVGAVYSRLSILSPGRLFGLDLRQDLIAAIVTLLLLFGVTAASAYRKYVFEERRPFGVVVVEEVGVFSEPSDDSTLQFKAHEGTRMELVDTRPGWLQIELPGELEGWVPAASVRRI